MTVCWLYVFVNVEGSYLHPGGKLLTSGREVTYIFEESRLFSCVSQNLIVTLTSSRSALATLSSSEVTERRYSVLDIQ